MPGYIDSMGEVFFLISDKSEFSCSMFDVITSDKPEKLKKSAKKCRKVRARKFAIPINLYQRLMVRLPCSLGSQVCRSIKLHRGFMVGAVGLEPTTKRL